ncbi:MAG: TIGR00282 family metallophosphoesterase [Nitrospirae bacterium]|nr:TIGR00282 family metallophosphoesterase [Nitrospirota bacterium]
MPVCMKVLFIGDIMGEPGRRVIARTLHKVVAEHAVDLVIGNGENAAAGFGITPELAHELFEMGLSVITTGNHVWDKKEILEFIPHEPRLLRPANYPAGTPGHGSIVVETPGGEKLGILQLMGRIYMPAILECPFQVARREIAKLKQQTNAIIVDMHAEATSEKMAMGHFLDGDVTAVVGTHTHVQTADEQILPKGTAYLTDIGMTGPVLSVIGIKKELAIEKFLTQMPRRFEVASGPAVLSAVLIELDGALGKAVAIRRIRIPE